MKCDFCNKDFPEKDIDESHDVPCYLFYNIIGRRLKKQAADKFPRHWLCKSCHEIYEKELNDFLIKVAYDFAKQYFKKSENGNTKDT